jgi:hypothetical protein
VAEEVRWKNDPDAHDYPAASSYLSLILQPAEVTAVVAALEKAPTATQKAKDILRAARLPLLPPDDVHVLGDLDKVKHGQPLSPILLLRGRFATDTALQIADAVIAVCASYHVDVNTDIPCRIADLP